MSDETLLVLSGPGVAPYSARGLQQTLDPIAQAVQVRRTVNGTLTDVSSSQFQKYRSTITGTDQLAPALDGVWPGLVLTVECIAELAFLTSGGGPARDVAGGSGDEALRVEGAYTYYRPVLDMMVVGFATRRDEYGAQVSWTLDLEEV